MSFFGGKSDIYGAKTEAATSVMITSLERATLVLSFDANYSIFNGFLTEMYLFPERVLVLSFDANYSIFSGGFLKRKCTSSLSGSLCFLLMPITQFLVGLFNGNVPLP